jgi:hypothetical protein
MATTGLPRPGAQRGASVNAKTLATGIDAILASSATLMGSAVRRIEVIL